jgi:RNA polymerase sigma-70 factor (ECF subfamily)
VRSAIADHYRARGRHQKRVVACAEGTCASHDHEGDETLDAREDADNEHSIDKVLASLMPTFVDMLDEPYRSAIALTELEGLLHKDAAERLGVSLSAMKSRVLRGRALLREKIEQSVALSLDARGGVVSCEGKGEFVCPCDD